MLMKFFKKNKKAEKPEFVRIVQNKCKKMRIHEFK